MKKLTLLLVVLLMALPLASTGAQVATPDLTALAAHAPSDTVVFTAMRTDQAFIDTLDGYAAALTSNPDIGMNLGLPPGLDVTAGLDMIAEAAGWEGSFAENTAPWLGDTAVFAWVLDQYYRENPGDIYELNLDDVLQPILIVETTDADAAATLLIPTFEEAEGIEASEIDIMGETATVYIRYPDDEGGDEPDEFDITVIFREDHFVFGTYSAMQSFLTADASLADNADFQETLALLPLDSYNAFGYGNQPAAVEIYNDAIEAGSTFLELERDTYAEAGSVVGGAVIQEGDAFTLDFAINGRGGEANLNLVNVGAVDFAFAENITTRFPLVIHATNLAGIVDATFETAGEIDESAAEARAEASEELEAEIGLTLDDVFGWMTADFALILGPSAQASDASSMMDYVSALPVEFGLLIDAAPDRDAAVAVVDAVETYTQAELDALADAAEVTLTREGARRTYTAIDNTGNVPFPVEIQFGLVDNLFVLGTPGTTRPGDPLTSSETFGAAGATLLPNPSSVYYIDFSPLGAVIEPLQDLDPAIVTTKGVLETLEYATISTAVDDSGNGFVRGVLDLRSE